MGALATVSSAPDGTDRYLRAGGWRSCGTVRVVPITAARAYARTVFSELLSTPGVQEVVLAGSPVGMMALHGGLEEGTYEIAEHVAVATGSSLYAVVQPDDLRWHVPSVRFDPQHSHVLAGFLASIQVAVSLHGFGRQHLSATVLIGGRNHTLAEQFAAELDLCGGVTAIVDEAEIPRGLRGMDGRNPVNLPPLAGVQLEMSPDLRDTDARDRMATALTAVVANLDQAELATYSTMRPA